MPVVDVVNNQGKKVSTVELSDELFNMPVKKSVLHEVVTMQLAGRRAGTAAVKRRSDIRGSISPGHSGVFRSRPFEHQGGPGPASFQEAVIHLRI